jgi:hypothetical protein
MYKSVLVTCHTPNCENVEIPVPLIFQDADYYACGPCGQTIEDVVFSEELYETFLPEFHALCDERHGPIEEQVSNG